MHFWQQHFKLKRRNGEKLFYFWNEKKWVKQDYESTGTITPSSESIQTGCVHLKLADLKSFSIDYYSKNIFFGGQIGRDSAAL